MPNTALALVLGVIAVLVIDAMLLGILVWPAARRRLHAGSAADARFVGVLGGDRPTLLDVEAGTTDGVPVAIYNRVVRFAAGRTSCSRPSSSRSRTCGPTASRPSS